MRAVMQTIFGTDDSDGADQSRGNCLQAAIASLLELPLDEVPHFVAQPRGQWWLALEAWFSERGIAVEYHRITDEEGTSLPGAWAPYDIPYLMSGPSPRGEFAHVVVARDHEIVHDPHPDGTGLAPGWRGVYYLLTAVNRSGPDTESER